MLIFLRLASKIKTRSNLKTNVNNQNIENKEKLIKRYNANIHLILTKIVRSSKRMLLYS